MNGDAIHDEIARLEDRIETLTGERERCRKISLVAKLLAAAGASWIVLVLLTILPFVPSIFLAAVAAALGGAVLMGSNKTTWEQTEAALREAEAQRAELIGRIELRLVGDEQATLH
jgi:hypothetical protein